MKYKEQASLLKVSREGRGLSQCEVGKKLGFASGAQYVSNMERGASPIAPRHMAALAKMLGVHLDHWVDAYLKDVKSIVMLEIAKSRRKRG